MPQIKYKEAVGLKAKKGKPAIGKRPEKAELMKLYVKESKSIREVAEILGCSKDMVYRSLKECGIERRTHKKKSILSEYTLDDLNELIAQKGFRKAGENLGITGQGLWNYMNRRQDKE